MLNKYILTIGFLLLEIVHFNMEDPVPEFPLSSISEDDEVEYDPDVLALSLYNSFILVKNWF